MRNEGLAEYTGIHVALPAGARDGWAVQRIEAREARADREGLSRSFAYATGPAYGLLLDDAAPGWTRGLDEDADLAALAAHAFSVRTDELLARASARIAAYDGVALERFEHERAAERERRQAAHRARYIEGPVLTLPVDDEFGYTFDPNAVSTLDGVGQVLATGRVQGGWGRLDVSGGVLLRRTERGIVVVVVPAPADPGVRPLSGDGWTLALSESWDVVPGERPGDFEIKRLP